MGVEIHTFTPALAPHFARLNIEWLEKYFRVEPIDHEVLSRPQAKIIDPGGQILFAVDGDDVLGTVAMKHQGDRVFELTKMAVTAAAQGRGIGRTLMNACIEWFAANAGSRLFLESHHSLAAALALYESVGFEHVPRPGGPSVYERADVYMVYHGA